MYSPWLVAVAVVGACFLRIQAASAAVEASAFVRGDDLCPCLESLDEIPLEVNDTLDLANKLMVARSSSSNTTASAAQLLLQYKSSHYGLGCAPHDIDTPMCNNNKHSAAAVEGDENNDDLSWCGRSWCWVDPTECLLLNRRSMLFPRSNRYHSYATCGEADSFTSNNRLASLAGKVLRVGLNSNSGGWLGAYSSEKEQFEGPLSRWSGPAVDFVKEAARRGNFTLQVTEPPAFLRNRSNDFFGGTSSFDYCVFSASLGYLDVCVAQYTVTDLRATATDWLLLGSAGVYMIGISEEDSSNLSFVDSIPTIFKPFTPGAWIFIVCFVIPILGTLMLVHERGANGSSCPTEEVVLVQAKGGAASSVSTRDISLSRSIVKSIYVTLLAVLQQTYEQKVVTPGAMLNLLGTSFFILTIIAVYTANLAAILTQEAQVPTISNLDDAVQAGWRFCSERKNMETILAVRDNVDRAMFSIDPVELGGDGKAGFNCPNCASRTRVFDFLDPVKAETDSRYCHAALAPSEDLELLQSMSQHCNKSLFGTPIQFSQTGIPIFEPVSTELTSFFLKLKNDGVFDKFAAEYMPPSQCPVTGQSGEDSSLSPSQLSGIWVVSFGLAATGLIVTFGQWAWKTKLDNSKYTVHSVYKRDQRNCRIVALRPPADDDSGALVVDHDYSEAHDTARSIVARHESFQLKRQRGSRLLNVVGIAADDDDGNGGDGADDDHTGDEQEKSSSRSCSSGTSIPDDPNVVKA